MTKAIPCLAFKWPFDMTKFDALCKLSISYIGVGGSETLWFISPNARKEVEAILAAKLEIEGEPAGTMQEVDVPSWKGKDSLEVIEAPSGWVVCEHQKPSPGKKPRKQDYFIPFALIDKLWKEVWAKYPLHTAIKFAKIAEDTCRALGLHRFFRKVRGCPQCSNAVHICETHWADGTATFDSAKFQGGKHRRKALMPYVYHPTKVFEALGAVKHQSHSSIRLKEELPIQTVFTGGAT